MLVILVALPGCSAFRADVGYGFGLGADLALPAILHPGFSFSSMKYAGHDYKRGWRAGRDDGQWEQTINFPLYHNICFNRTFGISTYLYPHVCQTALPLLADLTEDREPEYSWALEVDVYAGFVALRLGFNPWYLFGGRAEPAAEPETEPGTATEEAPADGGS